MRISNQFIEMAKNDFRVASNKLSYSIIIINLFHKYHRDASKYKIIIYKIVDDFPISTFHLRVLQIIICYFQF
jgi:hypothetical protein